MPRYVALILVAIIILGVGVAVYAGTKNKSETSPLLVDTADAYTAEVSDLISLYHNSTGEPVAPPKGGGSFTLAREIAQGEPSDVF
ncbi:MAG: molybdate ABC transporter substrate-binding protein, partial [Thermoprotei archaeon]